MENNISNEEYLQIQDIFLNPEAESIIIELMDSVWNNPDDAIKLSKLRADRLYTKIADDERISTSLKSDTFLLPRSSYWFKVAASVLLFCMLTVAGKLILFNKNPLVAYIEYKTTAGERLKINLPDGSEVWLNAGSLIRFPKNFVGYSREVQLDGEAFFDVVHDEKKPFKVYTGKVSTQVLGTAFNISTYKPQVVEVTVTRGMVSVQDEGKRLGMLTNNKQLDFNTVSKVVDERVVDAASYTAWTTGELVLNDVSMEEAAIRISRWFNVKIIFKNPGLKKCRLVVSFPGNVKFTQVMNIISRLNNFTYQVENKYVYLSGKGCK